MSVSNFVKKDNNTRNTRNVNLLVALQEKSVGFVILSGHLMFKRFDNN